MNFDKCLFYIFGDDHMFFWCLYSVNVVSYINYFWTLNKPCISGINSIWSWFVILFIHCLIQFANAWLRYLYYVHDEYWSVTSFSCNVLAISWFETPLQSYTKSPYIFEFISESYITFCSINICLSYFIIVNGCTVEYSGTRLFPVSWYYRQLCNKQYFG